MRAVLVGNYGVGNFGDEALREYFLKTFPEIAWNVVSAERGVAYPRLPFGLRSFFTPWWRTLGALRRSGVVVFGGGTLFTDVESSKACMLWWWHAFIPRLCGKPFILAFQGIGPFRTSVGEWCARWAVQRAAHVSVRDDASLERARRWRSDVALAFDPVLTLFAGKHGEGNTLVVIPRDNSTDDFFRRAEELWKSGRFDAVKILSFKPGETFPLPAGEAAGEGHIIPITSISALTSILTSASFVLTQRYHGAIAALAAGIPFETVSQGKGDKLASLSPQKDRQGLFRRVADGEAALRDSLSRMGKI